jgi:hypothetical protein
MPLVTCYPALAMKTMRKLHLWIGMLFAPTIIFFAISGALQVAGLHEDASSGLVVTMAQVHKNQTIDTPKRRPPAPRPPEASAPSTPQPPRTPPHRSQLLVVWFFVMALALVVSTGLGIYMAFAYKRDRVVILSLLGAGTAIPIISLFL